MPGPFLVVASTHLKNISQIGKSPPNRGENKNYFKPSPSHYDQIIPPIMKNIVTSSIIPLFCIVFFCNLNGHGIKVIEHVFKTGAVFGTTSFEFPCWITLTHFKSTLCISIFWNAIASMLEKASCLPLYDKRCSKRNDVQICNLRSWHANKQH